MTAEGPNDNTNRREFILRCIKAGLSIGAAGALYYALYDPQGPTKSPEAVESFTLPDFAVSAPPQKMSIVRGSDRIETVKLAFKALGGLSTFINTGDRVMLKVNAAFASPPMLSATSHPDLVREVARLCFQAGAADVVVTDNPINDPTSCFALTGIEKAALSAGARVMLPRESYFRPFSLPEGSLITNWPVLYEPFYKINKVIGMAPVKDHHRSGASMTLKNWYGLLGGRRNIFHQDIHNIIKELAVMIKPTLVILDGTFTMMSNGPTGGSVSDLKPTNTMIVSTDPVAADACGAALLDRKLDELPFIAKAAAAGAGSLDYEALNPVRVTAG